MATKDKKSVAQYASRYAVLASSIAKWKKIIDEIGPKPRMGVEARRHAEATKAYNKALQEFADFKNEVIDTAGGTVWDAVQGAQAVRGRSIDPRSGGPYGDPSRVSPFVAGPAPSNTGMPHSSILGDDFTPPQAPTSSVRAPDPVPGTERGGAPLKSMLGDDWVFVAPDMPDTPPTVSPDVGEAPGSATVENDEFNTTMAEIDKFFVELDNKPPFNEVPPSMNDPKYRQDDGDINQHAYEYDTNAYDRRAANYMQSIMNIQFRINSLFTKLGHIPAKDLTPDQQAKWADAKGRREEVERSNRAASEELKASRLSTDKHNKAIIELQKESLEIERIRALIDRGELRLAAQAAEDLNLREMRGQTLDFLESIATNPSALASLMGSDYGRDMLDNLGFGMLSQGQTPEDLSRFFSGGTAGIAPSEVIEGTWNMSRTEKEAVIDMMMRDFVEPHEVDTSDRTSGASTQFSRIGGGPVMSGPSREEQRATYAKAIMSQGGRRFEVGQARDPGDLSHPNWRQWRNIVGAGQKDAFMYEAALAGVSPDELMMRMQASRPGDPNYQAKYIRNRGRGFS